MAVGPGGAAPLRGRKLARRVADRQPRLPDAAGGLGRAGRRCRAGAGPWDHPGAGREPAAVRRAAGRAGPGTGDREATPAMGLGEVQSALARLYVEPALRDRFFVDPTAVGAELGLEAEDARE